MRCVLCSTGCLRGYGLKKSRASNPSKINGSGYGHFPAFLMSAAQQQEVAKHDPYQFISQAGSQHSNFRDRLSEPGGEFGKLGKD
jgi:hypothetical protein